MTNNASDIIAELGRLQHRATDLRARETQLADAGENDPASDAWKTAAIVAAFAEAEFEAALVEAWPNIIRAFEEKEKALALAGATLVKLDRTNADLDGALVASMDCIAVGINAVAASYQQANAEVNGHDIVAGRYDKIVQGWLATARAMLSARHAPPLSTTKEG